MKSSYCQSEPNWEEIPVPVKVCRAAPVCKSNLGVGAKHTLVKRFGDICLGLLREGDLKQCQSHHKLSQDPCRLCCRDGGRTRNFSAWHHSTGLRENGVTQCPRFPQLEVGWAAGAAGRGWERLLDAPGECLMFQQQQTPH